MSRVELSAAAASAEGTIIADPNPTIGGTPFSGVPVASEGSLAAVAALVGTAATCKAHRERKWSACV